MKRFLKKESPKINIADNFLPVSGQHVEYFVTDYALAADEFLYQYFPSLFKDGKPRRHLKLSVTDED